MDDATENKVEEETIVAPKAANAESKKQTYGELRAELLREFKARASELMTKERDKKTVKLDH